MSSPVRSVAMASLAAMLSTFAVSQSTTGTAPTQPSPVPVLVELFTSEGCSSCPPADEMLGNIRNMQPIPGENIIVLSEHVDYWDHDGWKDPFSSHDLTERQNTYASIFKLQQPYTPQMVVDGWAEFNGSDAPKAQQALDATRSKAKVPITLSKVEKGDKEIKLHLEIPRTDQKKLELFVAVADLEDETQVKAGENGDKTLHHVNVLRKLQKVTSLGTNAYSHDITVRYSGTGKLLVAFLQDPATGRIWGANSAKM